MTCANLLHTFHVHHTLMYLSVFSVECCNSFDLIFFQIRVMGLVVVRDRKVIGLHCSGAELHAGQAAVIQHGTNLADCELYFSRRPCATCLKMIINGERKDQ